MKAKYFETHWPAREMFSGTSTPRAKKAPRRPRLKRLPDEAFKPLPTRNLDPAYAVGRSPMTPRTQYRLFFLIEVDPSTHRVLGSVRPLVGPRAGKCDWRSLLERLRQRSAP